jgi:hypothetical protein
MAATRIAKQDLGASVFASPSITLGTAAVSGSAGTGIQTDATIIAFDATVPVTQAFSDAAAAGAAAVAARRDHKHGMMAAPATGLLASNFVFNEVPAGTVNGVNATFTLANTPTAGTVGVFKNGIRQFVGAGNDYTISGLTLTFLAGNIPQTGDNLIADYLK